ncbi:MAG: NAD(P)/FAD-dependent oxidoreductase [Nitrospirae bacterium]|nr:NAD(P)/FAD-dependent oxidoreductase [Nitrospirota bacterium]
MKHIIIGNGVAGTTAAFEIRKADPSASIQIVTEEPYPFYSRIRLPEFLAGSLDEQELVIRKPSWYEEHRISLSLNTRVTAIDPASKKIITSAGESLPYDRLLVATGANCFVPPISGAEKQGVFTLRGLEDAQKIREYAIRSEGDVLLIGGGVLGLEAGYGLMKAGCKITVVEFFPRLLPRQLDEQGAKILQQKMESMGFTFHLAAKSKEISGRDAAEALILEDGTQIGCDMVIISAGIRYNVKLLENHGAAIEKGVVVNDRMETGIPDIFAAGDLVQHRGICYGIWPAAEQQGQTAGINMAGGNVEYGGTVISNTLTVAGIDVFAAGDIDADRNKESITSADSEKFIYRKLVFDNNRIVGAILLGDLIDRRRVMKAIENRVDISPIKQKLDEWDLSSL